MKRRTYQYYVVVRNLGRDDEEFIHRHEEMDKIKPLFIKALANLKPTDTVYLAHLSVIEKMEG